MKTLRLLTAWSIFAGLAPLLSALEMFWEPLPGRAKDIGVGADGSVWIVGSGVGNGEVYRWDGTNFVLVGGSGVFIAVDPQGNPWVVNQGSDLYHRSNNQWELLTQSGSATSLGIGSDGTVLIAGGTSCFCGPVSNQRLFRYTMAAGFTELPGEGRAVVIEPEGNGWWVLDSEGRIYRSDGGPAYTTIDGHARDISRGANGDIWIIGGGAFELGNDLIYRWNGAQFEQATNGQARQISVGPDGTPWVVDAGGKIFRGHFLGLQPNDVAVTVGEDLRFPVSLSFPSDRVASVSYQVVRPDNSVASSGSLTFDPGVTQQVVVQPTAVNGIPGMVGIYRLQLTNPTGADLVRATANGTVSGSGNESPTLVPIVTTGNGFAVRLATRPGFRYQLQRRDGLGSGNAWNLVTSLDGTGGSIEIPDSSPSPNQAFYRVSFTPVVTP